MKKHKDILVLVISGFSLTVIWIASNVYHNHATSTVSETLQLQVNPIEPRFDTDTLERIKLRKVVDPKFEAQPVASPSAPSQTPANTSSTPTLTPSLSATPSGR